MTALALPADRTHTYDTGEVEVTYCSDSDARAARRDLIKRGFKVSLLAGDSRFDRDATTFSFTPIAP